MLVSSYSVPWVDRAEMEIKACKVFQPTNQANETHISFAAEHFEELNILIVVSAFEI